ncbi:MAG: DUF4837 family protein [Bacteroidales bacterium]
MKTNTLFRVISLVFLAFLLFAITACDTSDRPSKPSASGRAGELLTIMEPSLWDGNVGETFRDVFRAPVPMLPQAEPMFDVIFVPTDDFSKVFQTHRHIFFVEKDESLSSPSIEIQRDVWAYPQLVVRVKAPSEESINNILLNNKQSFYDRYLAVERLRLKNAYERMLQTSSYEAVKDMFGIEMAIPEGYFVAKEGEDFIWLRKSATQEEFDQSVMIWTLDYTDPAIDFDEDVIWERRDSITEQYIPGQFPGTYMTTYRGDLEVLRPQFRELTFNDMYAVEARSLWRVEGDFMGGPFVTYTFVDEQTNRLFMIDGWVFAPDYKKRDYMRQVEAIIWSLEFADREEEEDEEEEEEPAEQPEV